MKHALIVALALAASLAAGCGGGSSVTREEHSELERQLVAAQEAKKQAEEAAEAARLEAERQAAAARQAEQQRLLAEQQRQQEQAAREEAEREAAELEEEAGHTVNQLVQANARQVYTGLTAFLDDTDIGEEDPSVTPRYRESALVDTDPDADTTNQPKVTFSSITPRTSGDWFRTLFLNRAFDFTDRLDVYTDAESPDSDPFTSVYNEITEEIVDLYQPLVTTPEDVVDDNRVVGSVQISTDPEDRDDATSTSFPRSGEPRIDFDQSDRGEYTLAQRDDARQRYNDALATSRTNTPELSEAEHRQAALVKLDMAVTDILAHTGRFRDQVRHPLRYTAEVSGRLGGASGWFTCASDPETNCRVTNQNNHFRFVGPWVFTPLSASATVRVEDSEFMYFGWWARQNNSTGAWMYRTFHGPTESGEDGNRSTMEEISQLSGSATYQGPAVGQYSFYEPLGSNSESGEFSARATLRANFDDNMVDGTIDQFTDHEDWTLTLKQRAITGGRIAPSDSGDGVDAVSWHIEDEALAAPDSGTWEAAFYSNLSPDQRTTTQQDEDATPTGIAGTFEAEYHHVGRIIGAFGAHKQP